MKEKEIFILTGPSGVGKTDVFKRLLSDKNLNLEGVITCTTRKKREDEIDGIDYYFLSKKNFLKSLKNNEFFEHAKVYGNYYGSRKKNVGEVLNSGRNVIFVIDVQGAIKLKKLDEHCKIIFINAENIDELKNRLVCRNSDSNSDIEKRLLVAQKEMDTSLQFDFVITNYTGKLPETVKEIAKIISKQLKV